ncbi:unnamed protein product [Allacma fusca]|uniref:Histone deacetylase complex subunit SAP30 homolog n=1 Tax=Allacma fusca TaxID=39272 RepID=A0A8J2JZ55_9HEXA|nr:unnamed protein product [Allacma fusca]
MNGLGGGSYQSEDDYDDFNSKPPPTLSYTYNSSGNSGSSSSGGSNQNQPSLSGYGNSQSNARGQTCCLIDDGRRCHRTAGNASYSKRIQKTVYYKRLRLEIDTLAQHIYICDHHKMIIQSARARQKRDSEDEMLDMEQDVPEVDLYQLQVNTLRRYKKHYKIPTRPGLNKAQLADVLQRHFKTIPVLEKETVTYFIYMVKSERNKQENNKQEAQTDNVDRF